ncbi:MULTISPECIES: response regulator transcription factor [Chryseobacterium]|uniref:DNA-binding response OmpR family regulator n=1 Tax=Chryseobacterium camelliae TaxID=1265445 RepID=A0ABU0TF27_9FLAO|nr:MULTISPECIES: response regulator transcription factor [Chryseobacterium]MDT3406534.1 DNA-binding response OmpR family regulator [Pseudacidovorax intermedius]MDQ1095667.1 DNA-binding response OmpR family regulator [Chryseobacterium camelliae]MDQ1099604.1 DNA-binding response OmpR family regulator [Chryseobacterium sp. SORGH_AS_1048]MDR6086952.1 DNA-binding response OmpR family regulator [Chryseobacterium sp. SORGH_AS_0909]MDR6131324.1 DNA-binding response OmpR family regulator [Chryseobacter
MKYKVLYAEDEATLAEIITDGLKTSGYDVQLATDGQKALELFRSGTPNICVLDIMMPVKDGYTLAEDIRKLDSKVPIIFLSAKSLGEDVVKGFRSGGNDYLKKPFTMGELLVRMEALLTRFGSAPPQHASSSNTRIFGGCELNLVSQELKTPKESYKISYKETAILEMLLENCNDLLPRQAALLKIWGDDSYYNARSMDVFMSHLRKMLRDDPDVELMSIRGVGYKLIC